MSGKAGTRVINKLIVHCSASEFGCADRIRLWHLEKGWSDIGYHYVINNGKVHKSDSVGEYIEDGFIEKGRPDEAIGAHVAGHNKDSIGICMIGNYEFSEAQFKSLANLLRGLLEQYGLTKEDIHGHYEYTSHKTCPNFKIDWFLDTYMAD